MKNGHVIDQREKFVGLLRMIAGPRQPAQAPADEAAQLRALLARSLELHELQAGMLAMSRVYLTGLLRYIENTERITRDSAAAIRGELERQG